MFLRDGHPLLGQNIVGYRQAEQRRSNITFALGNRSLVGILGGREREGKEGNREGKRGEGEE